MARIWGAVLLVLLSPGFCYSREHIIWGFPTSSSDLQIPFVSTRNQHAEKMGSKGLRSHGSHKPDMDRGLFIHSHNHEDDIFPSWATVITTLRKNGIMTPSNKRKNRNGNECMTVDYYIDPKFEYNVYMIQAALDDLSASACIYFRPSTSRSIPLNILMKDEDSMEVDCEVLYGKREIHIGKDCLTKKEVMSALLRWLNYCPIEQEETSEKTILRRKPSFRNGKKSRNFGTKRRFGKRDGLIGLDSGNMMAVEEFNKSMVSPDSRKLFCEDGLPICCMIASLNGCSLFSGFTNKFCPISCGTHGEQNICSDTNPNCARWGSENKCLANQALMREVCPMTCGFCSPNEICFDNAPNCQDLAENGECERNPEYMVTTCRETCKFCKIRGNCTDHDANCPSLVGEEECLNEDTQAICPLSCGLCKTEGNPDVCGNYLDECPAYLENDFCETHPKFMQKFCPKSCGFCESEPEEPEEVVEEKFCMIGSEDGHKCVQNSAFLMRYCSLHVPGRLIAEGEILD